MANNLEPSFDKWLNDFDSRLNSVSKQEIWDTSMYQISTNTTYSYRDLSSMHLESIQSSCNNQYDTLISFKNKAHIKIQKKQQKIQLKKNQIQLHKEGYQKLKSLQQENNKLQQQFEDLSKQKGIQRIQDIFQSQITTLEQQAEYCHQYLTTAQQISQGQIPRNESIKKLQKIINWYQIDIEQRQNQFTELQKISHKAEMSYNCLLSTQNQEDDLKRQIKQKDELNQQIVDALPQLQQELNELKNTKSQLVQQNQSLLNQNQDLQQQHSQLNKLLEKPVQAEKQRPDRYALKIVKAISQKLLDSKQPRALQIANQAITQLDCLYQELDRHRKTFRNLSNKTPRRNSTPKTPKQKKKWTIFSFCHDK